MFFYLSFLRTPPHSSLRSSSVVFTPQVSNDLRTEPFPSNVDVFYWWISPGTPQNVAGTRLSEPAKLTTWRQENAYKPLQIPPPSKNVIGAAGIDCRLVMSTVPNVASSIIDLRDPEIGSVPLPVCSLPIRISPRQDGAGASAKTAPVKQEAITRTFRLFPGDGDTTASLMEIKETVSFDLDKKLWDSGIGLSAWLVRLSTMDVDGSGAGSSSHPAIVRELKERLFSGREECHVIELGAGTGIVSLVLAALRSDNLGSSSHDEPGRILSTDLPSSMELMSYNIRSNVTLYPNCPPTALPLDWDEELPETVRDLRDRGGFDLVVMADVTYNTSSFPALLRTLASLLELNTPRARARPLVLLAYKERDPAERQLWDMMARDTGVVLECVGKQAGGGGLPVEVWLGRRT
ncbi:putative methyltransferase-domain-containing protein [Russula dissimulans]|nr:putative methyltransferase-domain-containing protein [Russula dissimulans]